MTGARILYLFVLGHLSYLVLSSYEAHWYPFILQGGQDNVIRFSLIGDLYRFPTDGSQ